MKHSKDEFELIVEIAKRSEEMDIGYGPRITRLMDIDFANEHIGLRLEDMLSSKDPDFAHDFLGIQNHIDRPNQRWIDDLWVPRFAIDKSVNLCDTCDKCFADCDNGVEGTDFFFGTGIGNDNVYKCKAYSQKTSAE